MLFRLIGMMLVRRLVARIAVRHGDIAGAALGAALASRRTRALGLGGAAALTALELVRNRRQGRRPLPRAAAY